MSGRTRHLRDGVLITNRKTDRRQAEKRPLHIRLAEMNEKVARRYPTKWDVRLGFILPTAWRPFVADGPHCYGGGSANVFRGFVQITHGSSAEAFQSAIDFCAVVGKGKRPEIFMCVVRSVRHPDRVYTRWLSVVNGAMTVCSGLSEPRVFEARAA